ncbi:MAG: hypothetical protein E7434_07215 [Ruminococcaceae bacterium]|nr:hypothetical protein [Oscillospiraceae bacterium]
MKNEAFLLAIGQINDELVTDAEKRTFNFRKWGAVAVVLVLLLTSSILFLGREEESLPILTIAAEDSIGWGFEGYLAYDISELVNDNPWNATQKLSTLPVYRNLYPVTNAGPLVTDAEAQESALRAVADQLGIDLLRTERTDQAVIAYADGMELEADAQLTVTICFEPAVALPKTCNFSYYATFDEKMAVAQYLQKEYPNLVEGMEINVHGGDYNIYGERSYELSFYDNSGDLTERIVNYNFNSVTFYGDDEGKLWLIRVRMPNLEGKVGDYPIIGLEEARQLLSDGCYATSAPYAMPGMEYVAKAELIYRTNGNEAHFMPYYRFYVELPEEREDQPMKTYGAYYVPAVEAAYLTGLPVYDGSFN